VTDVVIAGYGPAGAAAAIAAHDAGRSVLVLESAARGTTSGPGCSGRTASPSRGSTPPGRSAWPGGHLIEHGGGLTDAMVFGRIAGTEAAARAASAALAATAPGVTA